MQSKSLLKLNRYIERIENRLTQKDQLKPKISKASVGWHLDHSLKVINGVIKTIEASDPKTYKNNFSLTGRFFLGFGVFPRGKARAPRGVRPPEIITSDALLTQLEAAKSGIGRIPHLDKNAFFEHPLFGNINKGRVLRFLETHTKHHLKIVDDILDG